MTKHVVYFFTPNNVRSIKTTTPKRYKKYANALIDPDVSKVRATPREYWKRNGDEIVEMTRPEKMIRKANIATFGAKNTLNLERERIKPQYRRREQLKKSIKRGAIIGMAMFAIICLPGGSCG